ncbi:hypothetical protein BN1051_00027 [Arthrobacter saudimassiliensis]|uniref:Uncharacterized protein n=1 Tax=Arthrobacter saudimassiliensis TaxID=1461584 RepID=A0A078MP15_9MICC|nr:hypothetical protein BN1051_00027 [Arthrobacter saudimassiliensis]
MSAEAAGNGLMIKRYTEVQRDSYTPAPCSECGRRLVPNWADDTRPGELGSRWIIRSYRYPGLRCSNHERRLLAEYFGSVQPKQPVHRVAGGRPVAPARERFTLLRLFPSGRKQRTGAAG